MKNKDLKKGKESIIGKIIYGFLLFMPLFAIGVTCFTNFFNKEDSIQVINKYETNEVNNYLTDLKRGNIYHFKYKQLISENGTYQIQATDIFNFDNVEHYTSTTISENTYFLYIDPRTNNIGIRSSTYTSIFSKVLTNNELPFEFDFVFWGLANNTDYSQYYEITKSNFNIVDNIVNTPREEVFYRAIDKVTESPLFNWAENSIIYTTTANTCNALSITTPFIPLLLAYWLIISVIYFLYDIALMLVWIIHRKIHEMQESI